MASRNVETMKGAHQAFNRRDFDSIMKLLADGFVYEDRARGMSFAGGDGFTEFLQGWTTAFSKAEISEPTYIDGGDVVVAEFRGRGTNDGPLGPLPATGKPLNLHFCEIARFDQSGQMVSGAIYYDQSSMLTQLGHAQPAARAGA